MGLQVAHVELVTAPATVLLLMILVMPSYGASLRPRGETLIAPKFRRYAAHGHNIHERSRYNQTTYLQSNKWHSSDHAVLTTNYAVFGSASRPACQPRQCAITLIREGEILTTNLTVDMWVHRLCFVYKTETCIYTCTLTIGTATSLADAN